MLEWAERAAVTARSTTSETVAMNNDDRARVLARFWSKVNKTDTCWLWTGARVPSNGVEYGSFHLGPRKTTRAHRAAYLLLVGEIPDGLTLDHLCGTLLCVRPDHLEPVTLRQNILRGGGPAAIHARQDVCGRGHPFSEENTHIRKGGWRACKTCRRVSNRAAKARVAKRSMNEGVK